MSVISLANYAGNSKLPDDIMRSLVTRSTDNASLSELARAYGYTEGPAVGVAVNVGPDTGEIRGGSLVLYGEDNPVVFKANMGVRKVWAEAIRTLNFSFEVRVEDVGFPIVANPGDDEKGFSAWMDMASHPGSRIMDGETVVEKHEWAERGVTGGAFRLAFVPVSGEEMLCYAQVVPVNLEDFRTQLAALEMQETFSGVVAIKLPQHSRVQLCPREGPNTKAGFATLPFIVTVGPEDAPCELPDSDALRQEVAGTLRSVGSPRKINLKEYTEMVKIRDPPKAPTPDIMWPEFAMPVRGNNANGEFVPRVLAKNKYSHGQKAGMTGLARLGVSAQFLDLASTLVGAAGAYNTLRVGKCAINKIGAVETRYGVSLIFPWQTVELVHFIMGCASDNLRASTVRCYVSQIKKAHKQSNLPWTPDTSIPNALLKGMENTVEAANKRIAVTPAMLIKFWERIAGFRDSDWSAHDRRTLWTLICFLWAGSFRISELLAPTQSGYVQDETFTWRHLRELRGNVEGVYTRWISVHLVKPKESRAGREGVNIEMFEISALWNPVRALDKMKEDYKLKPDPALPVFRWRDGRNITAKFFNSFIRECCLDLSEYPANSSVSSHSFRAGIVSMMSAMGCEEDLIKSVGRWSSDAWIRYAKQGRSVRKADQLFIQTQAALEYASWSPVPVMAEVREDSEIGG